MHKFSFVSFRICDLRWEQVEPVAPQRVQPAPMYVYQNMHHPNSTANLTSLSMAGTLPVRNRGMSELSIPVSR